MKKLLVILIALFVVVAGFFFWLGQRDTVKLTSADRELARKVEAGTLTSQDLEKLAQEGIKEYNKLTGESVRPTAPGTSSAPTVVPAGFKTGNWTETIQGKSGPVTVDYQITGPARGGIATEWTIEKGYVLITFQNITNVPIHLTFTSIDTDINGVVEYTPPKRDEVLDPGGFYNDGVRRPGGKLGGARVKIRAEAN